MSTPVPSRNESSAKIFNIEAKNAFSAVRSKYYDRFYGDATISDLETSFTVKFKSFGYPNQSGTNYSVLTFPDDNTSSGNRDSVIIKKIDRAVDGFTVHVWAAPGSGVTYTWVWRIFNSNPDLEEQACFSNPGPKGTAYEGPIFIPPVVSRPGDLRSLSAESSTVINRYRESFDSNINGILRQSTSFYPLYFDVEGIPYQYDLDYNIFVTPISWYGTPPDDAFVVNWIERKVTWANLWFSASPGLNSGIYWRWWFVKWV